MYIKHNIYYTEQTGLQGICHVYKVNEIVIDRLCMKNDTIIIGPDMMSRYRCRLF